MADRYLIETSAVDGYLLEDGSGVLILEETATTFFQAFSETWSASEALTRKSTFKLAIAETWQRSEAFVTKFVKKISFSETWQASESWSRVLKITSTLVETWQAVETLGTQFIAASFVTGLGLLRRIFGKQS